MKLDEEFKKLKYLYDSKKEDYKLKINKEEHQYNDVKSFLENLVSSWEAEKDNIFKEKIKFKEKLEEEINLLKQKLQDYKLIIGELLKKIDNMLKIEYEILELKDLQLLKEKQITQQVFDKIPLVKNLNSSVTSYDKNELEEAVRAFENQEYEDALKKFIDLLSYDENNEIINQYIALCYYNLGDLDKAKSYGSKVLEINPNNENIRSWLEKLEILK